MTDFVAAGVDRIRREAPLVHNVTNLVAMTLSANVLIAAGASPIMSAAPEEAGELAAMSGALVVNIGTLTRDWIEGAHAAVAGARACGPSLDPRPGGRRRHGVPPRDRRRRWWRRQPRIIRGNASEIMALAGGGGGGKGVDSTAGTEAAADAARALAAATGAVVAVTGAVDLVTDGSRTLTVANGHELLTRTTASGCASDRADRRLGRRPDDPLEATAGALAAYGVAAELAAAKAAGLRQLRRRPARCAGRASTAPPRRGWPASREAALRPRPLSGHRPRALRRPRHRARGRARRSRAASPWSSCATTLTPADELIALARRLDGDAGRPRGAADRQQPAGRRPGCGAAGLHVGQADTAAGRGARAASARRDPRPQHHRPRPARRCRSGAGRLSRRRPDLRHRDQARRRPGHGPGRPRRSAARGRRCPSSPSAASTRQCRSDLRAGADGVAVVSAVCGAARSRAARRARWPLVGRRDERRRLRIDRRALARRAFAAWTRPAPGLALPPPPRVEPGTGGLLSRPRPAPTSGRVPIMASGSTTATRCWPRPRAISSCRRGCAPGPCTSTTRRG